MLAASICMARQKQVDLALAHEADGLSTALHQINEQKLKMLCKVKLVK